MKKDEKINANKRISSHPGKCFHATTWKRKADASLQVSLASKQKGGATMGYQINGISKPEKYGKRMTDIRL